MFKPLLAVCLLPFTLAAADFTGNWASAPIYLVLKQDGNKLSGTGGPSAKDQQVAFNNGTVDGDRATFKVGGFQVSVQLTHDELRGEIRIDGTTQPVYLKRVSPDDAPAPRHFEVASVKHAPSQVSFSSSLRLDPGRLTGTNMSLKKLLSTAYEMKAYQIQAPDWVADELYNIMASIPAAATQEDVRVMIQNLLAERFKVKLHRETKEMPVYALVLEKTGHKMKETEFGHARTSMGNNKLEADSVSMRNVVDILSRTMDRPVLDMTGLTGYYTFKLDFTPDEAPPVPGAGPAVESPIGPALERALREQAGLRLETRRAPIEMLVIDSAEKEPVEN